MTLVLTCRCGQAPPGRSQGACLIVSDAKGATLPWRTPPLTRTPFCIGPDWARKLLKDGHG
jgi:hypothetical protein